MNADLANRLLQLAITLELIAIIPATPEILGEARLRKLAPGIRKIVATRKTAFAFVFLLTIVGLGVTIWQISQWVIDRGFFEGVSDISVELFLFAAGIALLAIIATLLAQRFLGLLIPSLNRLFIYLADNREFRRFTVIIGSAIFFIGKLIQLVSTF